MLVGLGGRGQGRKRSEAAKVRGWRECLPFILEAIGESNRGVRGLRFICLLGRTLWFLCGEWIGEGSPRQEEPW